MIALRKNLHPQEIGPLAAGIEVIGPFGGVIQRFLGCEKPVEDPPSVLSVTLSDGGAGALDAGSYNYRILYVDAQGGTGPSSDPTAS